MKLNRSAHNSTEIQIFKFRIVESHPITIDNVSANTTDPLSVRYLGLHDRVAFDASRFFDNARVALRPVGAISS